MKRSYIKTGAAVLCTALALSIYGNASAVLAYDGEIPYEDYGVDISERSETDQFYDYQEYAIYVKLPEAIGSNPSTAVREIAADARTAVWSVRYDRTISLEDNKAKIAEVMDYYLDLIEAQINAETTFYKPYDSSLTLAENGISFMDIMRYREMIANATNEYGDKAWFEAERDARSYYFEWLIQMGAITYPDDIRTVMALAKRMREFEYNDSLTIGQNLNRVYSAYRAINMQYFRDWDGM